MENSELETIFADLRAEANAGASDSDIFEPYRKSVLRDGFELNAKLLGIRDGLDLFSSDENILDVFDMAIKKAELTDKIENLKEEYIIKIRYLRKYFEFTYLHTLNLETVRALHGALVEVDGALRQGRLTADDITEETRALAHSIFNGEYLDAEPAPPKERWDNDDDRLPDEKAIEFLTRVWGEFIQNGQITRSEISEADPNLSSAIRQFYSRRKRSAVREEDALKGLPQWLQVWFEQKAIRSKSEVTSDLMKYDIKKPEDAFQRGLPVKEAQRLYNACKRRTANTSS